jgi:hypothetical protein
MGMRPKHQPRWSPQALSNSACAKSTVSFGQAIANSNEVVGSIGPKNPLPNVHWG